MPTDTDWAGLLTGITTHRANPPLLGPGIDATGELLRKVNEIEWALQSIVENIMAMPIGGPKE